MSFFLFNHPDIPEEWIASHKSFDQVANPGSAEEIAQVAEKYGLSYEVARAKLIEFHRRQSTFSVYDLCNHAISSNDCAISRFLKN